MQEEIQELEIRNNLHSSWFTRQRLQNVAMQQDIFLRQKYVIYVSAYSSDMFVFVDETGVDKRNKLRGYTLHGK